MGEGRLHTSNAQTAGCTSTSAAAVAASPATTAASLDASYRYSQQPRLIDFNHLLYFVTVLQILLRDRRRMVKGYRLTVRTLYTAITADYRGKPEQQRLKLEVA